MPYRKIRVTITDLSRAFEQLPKQPEGSPYYTVRIPISFSEKQAQLFDNGELSIPEMMFGFLFEWDPEAQKWLLAYDSLSELSIVST